MRHLAALYIFTVLYATCSIGNRVPFTCHTHTQHDAGTKHTSHDRSPSFWPLLHSLNWNDNFFFHSDSGYVFMTISIAIATIQHKPNIQMIAAKKWNWHEKLKHEKWNRIDIIYEFCARKKLNKEKKIDCCWSFVHTPISRYFMYICVKLCRHKVDNRTMSNGMAYNNNIYVRWPDDT